MAKKSLRWTQAQPGDPGVNTGETFERNPLTKKGKKILAQMIGQYGEEKGREVFWASVNAGKITGVER